MNYIEKYSAAIGYVVTDIEVMNENAPVYCVDIAGHAMLNDYKSKSIFLFESGKLVNSLKAIDCIDDVSIRKVFPSKVLLNVSYKTPVAVWNDLGKFYFITKDGKAINITQHDGLDKFIFISGMGAAKHIPELINFISNNQEVYAKIDKAIWVSDRRWDVIFTTGAKILLPEENPSVAWNKFVLLQKEHPDFVDWKFKVVDFRVQSKIYVR